MKLIDALKTEKISAFIIAMIVMLNVLQFALSLHGIMINTLFVAIPSLLLLAIINRFSIEHLNILMIMGIVALVFSISLIIRPTNTLYFYIREYFTYVVPILIAFLFKKDWETFLKSICALAIIGLLLMSPVLIDSQGLFEDYMTLGYYGIFCSTILLVYSYNHRKLLVFLAAISYSYLIVVNGNRGALLVASLALLLCFLLAPTEKKVRRQRRILIIVVFAVLSILAGGLTSYLTEVIQPTSYSTNQFLNMLNSRDIYDALGTRGDIYKDAIKEIQASPLVGMGIGGFEEKYGNGVFPHNIILDIFVTFGIPVGIGLIVTLYIFLKKMYYKMNDNKDKRVLYIFLVAICAKLLLSKVFIYDPFFWLLIAAGATALSQKSLIYHRTETENE